MVIDKLLTPIINLPDSEGQSALDAYAKMLGIFRFVDLDENTIEEERLQSALYRVHYSTALEGVDYQFEHVKQLVNNEKQPLEQLEREVMGYHQAEMYLFKRMDLPFDVYMINDMQQVFFSKPPEGIKNDLFTSQIYTYQGVDLSLLYDTGMSALCDFLQHDTQWDPLTQSWVIHFFVMMKGPWGQANGRVARLLQFNWLLRHNLTLAGLLVIEQQLYKHKAVYISLCQTAMQKGKEAKLDRPIDFTDYIKFGYKFHKAYLETLQDNLKNYYTNNTHYNTAGPRLKNVINYVFEKAGSINFESHQGLNERQQQLMQVLYRQGVIQTKELFDTFDVNRKTLQRDFIELAERGLIKVTGEGRGVKYTLNMGIPLPAKLQRYQAIL
ncbi:MAG: DeoR family transcriptional regulator [Bacteroidota bacterium]|nr:DeoR family transcriptional regulator [Bacteroidota bacterium]